MSNVQCQISQRQSQMYKENNTFTIFTLNNKQAANSPPHCTSWRLRVTMHNAVVCKQHRISENTNEWTYSCIIGHPFMHICMQQSIHNIQAMTTGQYNALEVKQKAKNMQIMTYRTFDIHIQAHDVLIIKNFRRIKRLCFVF